MKALRSIAVISFCITALCCSCSTPKPIGGRAFRGFMIDAPRTVESIDYYFRLIDFCGDEGLNAIIFRLTDDQGSAFLFRSHPELKMCPGAFSADELKKIIQYAGDKGIEIIPEVESFGHAGYILKSTRYASLTDGAKEGDFNAVCPVSDTTLQLMKDLYTEVAAVFHSPYFHIGCDEINWGASDLSKKALQTRSRNQVWSEYVNKLNGYVKTLGKKTMIWGDVPIYQQNEVLDQLDKDIVIIDWNYWETKREKVDSIAGMLTGKGFQAIGGPAVSWCMWGPRVGALQFDNLNAYAAAYGKPENDKTLGIIMTNWVPQKYIQNSMWDTYTIAAEIVKHNGNYPYLSAVPEFVSSHYGVTPDSVWTNIYKAIYENSRQFFCAQNNQFTFFPWSTEEQMSSIIRKNETIDNPYGAIKERLLSLEEKVTKHKDDFNDFLLTIEFMDYCYKRQNDLLAFAHKAKTDSNGWTAYPPLSALKDVSPVSKKDRHAEEYLNKVAMEDESMMSKIDAAWKKGRRAAPLENDKDYMWSFRMARDFSSKLSRNPDQLLSLIAIFKK